MKSNLAVSLGLGVVLSVGCSAKGQEFPTDDGSTRASPPVTITVGPPLDDGRLRVGTSVQVSLVTNIPDFTVSWAVGDTAIATSSSTGLITGWKTGSTTLNVVVTDAAHRNYSTGFPVVVFP